MFQHPLQNLSNDFRAQHRKKEDWFHEALYLSLFH